MPADGVSAQPLLNRTATVTAWRESIPPATAYNPNPIVPGENFTITDPIRIRFTVTRSLTKTPDQADIYITNLAESTQHDLATLPLNVSLSAGYGDVSKLLFSGELHFGLSETKAADWETLLQCGDGQRAFANARVNRSYPEGTSYLTVVKNAASAMGLTLPNNVVNDAALQKQFTTGKGTGGFAADELTRLLAPFGYGYCIQNGKLVVLRDGEVNTQTTPYPIDVDHGMIGSPQYGAPPRSGKPPHVRVRCLLYPELMPGDAIQLTSRSLNGLFRIEKIRHEGDTWEGDFLSTLEILPYSASSDGQDI